MITVIMARRQPFTLAFASEVTNHLRAIEPKYHSLIREKIGEQLRFEPAVETTNRKPLRQPAPFGAQTQKSPDHRGPLIKEAIFCTAALALLTSLAKL